MPTRLDKVGKDGVVTVEEGKGVELSVDYKEGMEFDKGYASAYFVTNPEKMEAEIEDPYILITDKKISSSTTNFFRFWKIWSKFPRIW